MYTANLSLQRVRDESRVNACKQKGITLLEIPYWWNNDEGISFFFDDNILESLLAAIILIRPDLRELLVTPLSNRVEEMLEVSGIPLPYHMKYKDKGIILFSSYKI